MNPSQLPRPGSPVWLAPLLVALAALAFLLARTAPHGPGLDFDGAQHLAAAASLLEGRGWLGVDGEPYVLWPPLYSGLIALVASAGLELGDAVRALHGASLLATTLLAAQLAWRIVGTRLAATLAAAAVAWVSLGVSAMAWSESVFLALVFAALVAWERWRRSRRTGDLAWLAAFCALMLLQRYFGAFLLALLCVSLLVERDGSRPVVRLRRSLALGFAASLPTVAWFLRNALVATERTARRGPPSDSWSKDALDLLAQFVPLSVADPLELTVAVGGSLALVAGAVLAVRGRLPGFPWLLALYPIVHGVGLVLLRQWVEFDPIDARLMAPAHAVVAGFVALLAARALLTPHPLARTAAAAWLVFVLSARLPEAAEQFTNATANGIGVYDSPQWTTSECAAALRETAPSGAGYSNDPCAIFLLTGLRVRALPVRPSGFPRLYRRWSEAPQEERWIAWFRLNERARLPVPDSSLGLPIEKGPSFADADIWLVRQRGQR